MQCVAPIALQVTAFRRRLYKHVQSGLSQKRADWVNAWAAVAPDGCEKAEPHPELIEEVPTGVRQVRTLLAQLLPARRHGGDR